jgi:hypothetical protein
MSEVPKPSLTRSVYSLPTDMKYSASLMLKPLSITMVIPELRGFAGRSGRNGRTVLILELFVNKDESEKIILFKKLPDLSC